MCPPESRAGGKVVETIPALLVHDNTRAVPDRDNQPAPPASLDGFKGAVIERRQGVTPSSPLLSATPFAAAASCTRYWK